MTYNEAKNILDEQKRFLEITTGFDAWLDTTENYIVDIFNYTSTQASNFRKLKSDYSYSKIGTDEVRRKINENNYKKTAYEQITGLIHYLNKKELLDKSEQERKQEHERIKKINESEVENQRKNLSDFNAEKPKNQLSSIKQNWFQRLGKQFMSLKIQAWSIIIGTWISGMFGMYKVGYDVGSSKFDKDKNDLYQKNQTLLNTVNERDRFIRIKSDSVNILKNLLHNPIRIEH